MLVMSRPFGRLLTSVSKSYSLLFGKYKPIKTEDNHFLMTEDGNYLVQEDEGC